jgi:hypothetical protein
MKMLDRTPTSVWGVELVTMEQAPTEQNPRVEVVVQLRVNKVKLRLWSVWQGIRWVGRALIQRIKP